MPLRAKLHYPPGFSPPENVARRAKRRNEYDLKRCNDPVRLFHMSVEWRDLSKRFLRRFPMCCKCGACATQVDHMKPVRENWSERMNIANLQPMCQSCHSRKTAAAGFGRIES